jgi:hypothetical protein
MAYFRRRYMWNSQKGFKILIILIMSKNLRKLCMVLSRLLEHDMSDLRTTYLLAKGFTRGQVDLTLFIRNQGNYKLIAQIYVDDIIFGATLDS